MGWRANSDTRHHAELCARIFDKPARPDYHAMPKVRARAVKSEFGGDTLALQFSASPTRQILAVAVSKPMNLGGKAPIVSAWRLALVANSATVQRRERVPLEITQTQG